MPFISRKALEWLFSHSYYPTFKEKGRFHFGTLPPRRTIEEAIEDAIKAEQKEKTKWK